MASNLERSALAAEIYGLEALLTDAPVEDVAGRLQLRKRITARRAELEEMGAAGHATATLSVLFGGRPVQGAESIDVEFAAKALDSLQSIIKKQMAAREQGPLPPHGPLNVRNATRLGITALEHQSVGFRLEEFSDQIGATADSPLVGVVAEVVDLLADLGDERFDAFEAAIERTDPRQLPSLRDFFGLLEDSEAVVRLAEPSRERSLDIAHVHRARTRVDAVRVADREDDQVVGRLLGIVPVSKRFDMALHPSGQLIRGTVSAAYSTEYLNALGEGGNSSVVGHLWVAKMKIREIQEPNRPLKVTYSLLGLVRRLD